MAEVLAEMEALVQADDGGRGIAALIVPGALQAAQDAVWNASPRKVLLHVSGVLLRVRPVYVIEHYILGLVYARLPLRPVDIVPEI